MSNILSNKNGEHAESHWLSVSDLMAGLMMVFLFIAVAFMRDALVERDKIKEVAVAYQENQVAIYEGLMHEFAQDLNKWNADIDRETLTFIFKSPDILFNIGEIELKDKYKRLLDDFFPRYIQVLLPFFSSIDEIRIEGHTSSDWNRHTTETESYFLNMELSQGRTRSVLGYVYGMEEISPHRNWIKKHIAAVGLSSSQRIINAKGIEDRVKSRRVTFRIITSADTQIKNILDLN